nr:MAG TPA: hypothetical protein [Caudoviricetes sp.]
MKLTIDIIAALSVSNPAGLFLWRAVVAVILFKWK